MQGPDRLRPSRGKPKIQSQTDIPSHLSCSPSSATYTQYHHSIEHGSKGLYISNLILDGKQSDSFINALPPPPQPKKSISKNQDSLLLILLILENHPEKWVIAEIEAVDLLVVAKNPKHFHHL